MPGSELKKALKEKRANNVKRIHPGVKKFLVTLINFTGSLFFIFRRNKPPENVNKVLFISLYFYGDVIFQSALFELVHKLYPQAEMHIWVKSRTKAVLEGYPYFSKIHVFDDVRTRRFDENARLNLSEKFKFFRLLKSEKYDLIFDLTGLFWTAFAAYKSKPKYSSGLNFQGFGFFYNFETEAIYKGHLVDKHLNLLLKNDKYNIAPAEIIKNPAFYITQSSRKSVEKIFNDNNLNNGRKKIVVHTTAGWNAKKWDIANFIKVVEKLSKTYDIFIIGGNEDTANAELILKNVSNNVYDFSGKLSINESAELTRRADWYIGADSGPLYIAEAVGTPTLSLFGPTNPLFSAPRGENHAYIYKEIICSADKDTQNCKLNAGLNCKTFDCMKMILPQDVFGITEKVIG